MAGKLSADVNAKILVLNHISTKADRSGSEGSSRVHELVQQEEIASRGISRVVAAYDFMELLVPWMGFGADTKTLHDSEYDEDEMETPIAERKPKFLLDSWFR
jgi:hypothetical protein